MPVESTEPSRGGGTSSLEVQLLGPLTISRDGVALALPASRKVRALFAYLSLAPRAVTRSQLCELLWDVPNDPRGELRWCLSKIRRILDQPHRRRIDAREDTIRLDLSDCRVDAIEIARATRGGVDTLTVERLRTLSALFAGDFLGGLEIDRSPVFSNWLIAQRRRFRGCHAALLEHLIRNVPDDEAFGYLEQLLELAPFDQRVHETLFNALARRGRIREGEEHLQAAAGLFEADGLDHAPLREAWRSAQAQADGTLQVSAAASVPAVAQSSDSGKHALIATRRASVAVMPFVDQSTATNVPGGLADGFAHDVITGIAKLRSLFVIAQGTVFALRERRIAPEEAGRMLNVDYFVGGSLYRRGKRLTVSVELVETRTARIAWAEVFDHKIDDIFVVLDELGNRIVASIAQEVEAVERNRAILKPPNSLDAWGAHHRGLWHMYRFTRADNEQAQHCFETAVRLDPTFAPALAGLSFTHFQNGYQGWAARGPEMDRALATAEQALMADDRDPTAHWAMGRALWLRGSQDQSIVELEKSIDLSPNFASGHYMLSFVLSQAGDPDRAIEASDYSRHLSPFDPLLFCMHGTRAMALVRLRRFDEAADWGIKTATHPNAFSHFRAMAAYSLALAGRLDEARTYLASIRKTLPHYGIGDFLAAMRFEPEGAALFRKGANLAEHE